MLEFFERCRAEYGTLVSFRLGHRRIHLLSEPELIEQVLVTQNRSFKKHYAFDFLKPLLGNGLLTSEGEFWLKQRRLMQPAFSRKLQDRFLEIVRERTNKLMDDWSHRPRFELHQEMSNLTVEIAAEAFLGVELQDDLEAIGRSMEILHQDFERRFRSLIPVPIWIPTRNNRVFQKSARTIIEIVDRLVETRRRNDSQGADALSLLLQCRDESGASMSARQVRDEVITLLLAGHDTTANALSWAFVLLSRHPEAADKLAAEGSESTEFAGQVLREAMRLYPPAFVFGRQCIRACELGGVPIRSGDTILMAQWLVHRDERFFDEPAEFRPDRWEDDLESRLPPYAYFPFGGGPRICIGKELALLEGTLILQMIGRRFRFETSNMPRPRPAVTLRPEGEVVVECRERTG